MSVWEVLRDPVARDARVLARLRKNGDEDEWLAIGDVGEGNEKAGWDAERLLERSEVWDMDREPMGTVSLFRLGSELRGFHARLRLLGRDGSSGGISSGAGSGRPLTTATS